MTSNDVVIKFKIIYKGVSSCNSACCHTFIYLKLLNMCQPLALGEIRITPYHIAPWFEHTCGGLRGLFVRVYLLQMSIRLQSRNQYQLNSITAKLTLYVNFLYCLNGRKTTDIALCHHYLDKLLLNIPLPNFHSYDMYIGKKMLGLLHLHNINSCLDHIIR